MPHAHIHDPKMKVTFQQNLMTNSATLIPAFVTGFHALSDPLRIQVLELLRSQELCVCELCEHLELRSRNCLSTSKLSRKPVFALEEGRWIYYSLNLPQFVVQSNIYRVPPPLRCCQLDPANRLCSFTGFAPQSTYPAAASPDVMPSPFQA